jgi:hypothetical protein
MTAKAANRLPLTPKRKPLDLNRAAICPLPRPRYFEMFPARQYPRTRLTSLEPEGFSPHFWHGLLCLRGFSRDPENQKQKGRHESRPSAIHS